MANSNIQSGNPQSKLFYWLPPILWLAAIFYFSTDSFSGEHTGSLLYTIAHWLVPSLTVEQIYATVLYYLHNRDQVDHYMAEWLEHGERMRAEQEHNPTPAMLKLRQARIRQDATTRRIAETQAP